MTRFTVYLSGMLVALFLLLGTGFAKSAVRIPSELAGTQQVMKVLRQVNLSRTEQVAPRGAVDILEFKSQLYNQKPLLRPGVAGLNITGKASPVTDSYQQRSTPVRRRFPSNY